VDSRRPRICGGSLVPAWRPGRLVAQGERKHIPAGVGSHESSWEPFALPPAALRPRRVRRPESDSTGSAARMQRCPLRSSGSPPSWGRKTAPGRCGIRLQRPGWRESSHARGRGQNPAWAAKGSVPAFG